MPEAALASPLDGIPMLVADGNHLAHTHKRLGAVVAPRDPREFDQRDEGRSIARAACRGARVAGGRRSPRLAVLAALRAAARGRRDSLPRRCAPSTGSLRGRWTRGMPRAGAQSLGMLTALACGLLRADAKTPRRSPARGSAA
jgi:hypothetical protein